MQSFEEFKKSRLAMDPTSRQLTDLQWEQAYNAHKASRQRVSGGRRRGREPSRSSRSKDKTSSTSGKTRKRRSSEPSVPAPANYSSQTKAGLILRRVRAASAYGDLRLLINLLAYVLLGLVLISVGIKVFFFTGGLVVITAILEGLLQIAGIFLLRYLAHVLVDIPDVMLYRELNHESSVDSDLEESSADDTAS